VGSLTGNAGKGALIGGVGGAAIGALTTPPAGSGDVSSNYESNGDPYTPRCVRWSSFSGRCMEWTDSQ
jgi:hypothetical protein